MKKFILLCLTCLSFFLIQSDLKAARYRVGVGDILNISIIRPEQISSKVTVSPSGYISVPYIGSIRAKGKTINSLTKTIQKKLARNYLKYPVITISLIESRSRSFTISGEVIKPGKYPLDEDTTVLKAISIAGGFTKFGSKSKVKILRKKRGKIGYKSIKVNIKAVINGDSERDAPIRPGDIIIVSESFF